MSYVSKRYTPIYHIAGLSLVGVGMGMYTPPNNSRVMGAIPSSRLGITGGMLSMSRTLGMGLGVTLGGLSYQLFLRTYGVMVERNATLAQMIPSFRDAYIVLVVIGIAVVFLSLFSNHSHEQ